MIETAALWDHKAMVKRQAMLPPWSPKQRQNARRELAMYGDHALTTILREERITRADNIAHYCRKCRGLGTKRHHAMCPKRGVWRQTYRWVLPGYESGQDKRRARERGDAALEHEAHFGNGAVVSYYLERDKGVAEKVGAVASAMMGR